MNVSLYKSIQFFERYINPIKFDDMVLYVIIMLTIFTHA